MLISCFFPSANTAEDIRQNTEIEDQPKPVFRSYNPEDENLKKNTLGEAKSGNIEERVLDQLDAGKPVPVIEEVDLVNLAPRKPDWDLKRDAAKKLEKLERRTQKAIAELIRERLQEGKVQDLAFAVTAGSDATQKEYDSD